jgi:membrane-bound serine protease (ClpP class)
MDWITLYCALVLAGFVLIGTEIFIPGGILGIFGSIAWIAAGIAGWKQFPAPWNLVSSISLLFIGILTFIVWIRYFPKSRIGKSLALTANSADCKSHKHPAIPIGTEGKALSTLRPSGIALFDGKRLDVVADGEWIEAGNLIKISSTNGGNISVVKV